MVTDAGFAIGVRQASGASGARTADVAAFQAVEGIKPLSFEVVDAAAFSLELVQNSLHCGNMQDRRGLTKKGSYDNLK